MQFDTQNVVIDGINQSYKIIRRHHMVPFKEDTEDRLKCNQETDRDCATRHRRNKNITKKPYKQVQTKIQITKRIGKREEMNKINTVR